MTENQVKSANIGEHSYVEISGEKIMIFGKKDSSNSAVLEEQDKILREAHRILCGSS